VLASALDAVITMDARGVITSWNANAEAMFGWPAAAAIGRQLADTIIPSRYRDAHRRGLAHFVATGDGPFSDGASRSSRCIAAAMSSG